MVENVGYCSDCAIFQLQCLLAIEVVPNSDSCAKVDRSSEAVLVVEVEAQTFVRPSAGLVVSGQLL